jgi:phosphatidylinositol alpha-1,6-mannosyltransferase
MYLIVTRSFPPDAGGMQNLMWGLTNSLSKHHMVKVFADQSESKTLDEKVSYSIDRIGGPKLIRKYRKAYFVNDFIKNNKNIKGIIADHWKSLELIKTKKKKICLIHSKEINHDKGSMLNRRVLNVLNSVDYVVSNSEYTKNLAINCGVNSDKIIVINPGVEPLKQLSKNILFEVEDLLQNKSPRLITVSRLDKRKNHEKIIMSLRNLKQLYPNIIYTCIGHGEEEENIKKLVNELNVEDHVLFFKNISQELKNALLAKSNLFVMPSIIYKKSVEGFGIAYIEAAQYGIPSIGGKDGGASDAILDKETGIICDGNNLDDIYSSIDLMLKNNSYKNFSKKTLEFAKKFEWSNIIKKYLKIL